LSISDESSNIISASAIRDAINTSDASQYNVIDKYQAQDSGATVTEGWANHEGEPANPQVDFVSLEHDALSLKSVSEVPEDQRKYYPYVATFAWTFFILAGLGVLTFIGYLAF